MTIATLGIKIDSSDAPRASKELDKLKASAIGAEKATAALEKSTAANTLRNIESAAKRAGVSVDEFRARMAKASQSAAPLAASQTKVTESLKPYTEKQKEVIAQYETLLGKSVLLSEGRNREAAQFVALRKAGTTADTAYGKSVAHLSGELYDLEVQQNKANKSGENLANTLTRRLIFAVAISQIRQLTASLTGLVREAARVGDLGQLTGLGSQGIQGVTSAAGFKGIAGDAFSGALVAFNQQIPIAKAGIGSLGELLRVNRVTVTDTSDAFFKVANLVKNAASDTARLSILQQAGLPATMEMARFLGQGSAAIREAAANTSKLTDAQVKAARELEDRWNELWTNFKTGGKRAVVEVADTWIDAWNRPFMDPSTLMGGWWAKVKGIVTQNTLSGGTQLSQSQADAFYGATGAGRPAAPVNNNPTRDVATEKAIAQHRISQAQQRLGLLGATTSALEAQRAVELSLQSAALNGVGIDRTRAETLKRLAYEQNLGITAMKSNADAARVEAETIGMSVGQVAEYTAVQNALNEAKRNGKMLSSENVEAIRREAAALGEAVQNADMMKWAYSNLVNGPLQTFRSELSRGASAWDALKSASASALNSISTKLMDMASQQLWQAAFPGGGSGGVGGGLLSLLGLGGGGGGASVFNMAGSAGAIFAKGGVPSSDSDISRHSNQIVTKPTFFAKGGNVMGEAGPEAVMPLVRTPDGNLGVRSQGGSNGSVAPSVTIGPNHYDFRGANPNTEAELKRYVDKKDKETLNAATQAVAKLHASAPGSYLRGVR